MAAIVPVTAPTIVKTLLEGRWVWEYFSWFAFAERRVIESCDPGDGRPILVLPGFLATDHTTWPLRRFLSRLGYPTFGWEQGVNLGFRPGMRIRLLRKVAELFQRFERPLTVIGWSLGGVYARDLATTRPDQIGTVITLGSPQQGNPRSTAVWRLFQWLNRKHLGYLSSVTFDDYLKPLTVPSLSIYSRGDGIVPWEQCRCRRGQGGCEQEVSGSHVGLVHNAEAMRAISDYLRAHPTRSTRGEVDFRTIYVNERGL